jgi:hypothetical protein
MTDKSNKPVVKPEVLDFSGKVQKELSIDNKTGVVTGDLQKVYDANLPDGITTDTVKKLSEYDGTVVNGTIHAVGTMAVSAMAKHAGLNRVEGEFQFGHRANLNVAVNRKREVVNNFSENKETIVKHGAISAEVHFRAGRNNSQLTAVKQTVASAAADALKK